MQRIVLLNDNEVRFSNIEFEILYLLASNPGRVFTTEQINNIVWNGAYFGDYADGFALLGLIYSKPSEKVSRR